MFVGINQYETEQLRPLNYAVADVLAMRELLKERMELSEDRILMLTNPLRGNKLVPKRPEVLKALQQLSSAPMSEEDTFIFYFAGHGFSLEDETYLMTADSMPGTRKLLQDTAVSVHMLEEYLREIRAGQQLLILDACRNEPVTGRRQVGGEKCDNVMSRDLEELAEGVKAGARGMKGRTILSGCWDQQVSYEYAAGKQGWFCENLMKVFREEAGGELRITNDWVAGVGKRMLERAWKDLPDAKYQTPHAIIKGEPVRLKLKPLVGRMIDLSQPEKVVVKDVEIARIDMKVERIAQAQVELEGLPPIPVEILELEGELAGIEQALKELEKGTHRSLHLAQELVKEAEEQCRLLEDDLQKYYLGEKVQKTIEEALKRDFRTKLTELCKLAPETKTQQLLPFIYRIKNVIKAQKVKEETRHQYEKMREDEQEQLKKRLEETRTKLLEIQEVELRVILRNFFQNYVNTQEFPLEAWMKLEPQLLKRRSAWQDRELLSLAEEIWEENNQNEECLCLPDISDSLPDFSINSSAQGLEILENEESGSSQKEIPSKISAEENELPEFPGTDNISAQQVDPISETTDFPIFAIFGVRNNGLYTQTLAPPFEYKKKIAMAGSDFRVHDKYIYARGGWDDIEVYNYSGELVKTITCGNKYQECLTEFDISHCGHKLLLCYEGKKYLELISIDDSFRITNRTPISDNAQRFGNRLFGPTAFSDCGRFIAFMAGEQFNKELFVYDVQNESVRRIASTQQCMVACWDRGRPRLYYSCLHDYVCRIDVYTAIPSDDREFSFSTFDELSVSFDGKLIATNTGIYRITENASTTRICSIPAQQITGTFWTRKGRLVVCDAQFNEHNAGLLLVNPNTGSVDRLGPGLEGQAWHIAGIC